MSAHACGKVMERWRTSCPRLTIWEDALNAGLVAHVRAPGATAMIELTARGAALPEASRPT
jgi:hypothetical protein